MWDNKIFFEKLNVLLNEDHVLPMSYGHLENNRIVIDRGVLKGLESYIVKYDKRNRLANVIKLRQL